MKLTIPEPKIKLYEDGLAKHDKLDRKPMAEKLSDLVESIDDPLVIALDGGWGSGKSVFLKCWVGEHEKVYSDKTTTLYFDAFEHDYLDDPLIALTGALAERLKKSGRKPAALKKFTTAAYKFAPMATRLGLAAVTAGGTEIAGAIGDALINQSAENVEKAAEAYWKREDGRRGAMAQFREALTDLTKPDENDAPTQKLVIVIDELDRCRPDYALQMLEVIKHFFATPGVHFVLGTNMQELANSVRARYGAGIDAERYLHKFVQITMPMPMPVLRPTSRSGNEICSYFDKITHKMQLPAYPANYVSNYLASIRPGVLVTLRDLQRLATLVAVAPTYNGTREEFMHLLSGLMIIKTVKPRWIADLKAGTLRSKQVFSMFQMAPGIDGQMPERNSTHYRSWEAYLAWLVVLDGKQALAKFRKDVLSPSFIQTAENSIHDIVTQYLDAFELPD